jgi:two-component system cell cycle response regulator
LGQQETRVTKVSRLVEKIRGDGEICLVQIYPTGDSLGRKWPIDEDELTVGRDTKNEIVVDLDNVSRRHAKFTVREGKVFVADLGSTNGTYLNDTEVHEETELRSGDLVKVGGSIFKFLSGTNIEALYFEEIHRMAIVDGLTQIFNKRYLLEFMEREMARCHRYGRALSLIMFDIDHFKRINDDAGHLAGDYVLRELAYVVKQRVRKEECFARYGGEEFAIVMPESGREKVRKFAEKLLALVAGHEFVFEGKSVTVTISIGVTDVTPEVTEPSQFIKAADQMLYKAKREGRNQVCG